MTAECGALHFTSCLLQPRPRKLRVLRKQFALRWRTESEVLSGAGESTCGNTRCELHRPIHSSSSSQGGKVPGLKTVELPFAYEEHGERKNALVKVVLCKDCLKKLMYKHEKGKGKLRERENGDESMDRTSEGEGSDHLKQAAANGRQDRRSGRHARDEGGEQYSRERRRRNEIRVEVEDEERRRDRRKSRSASPSRLKGTKRRSP